MTAPRQIATLWIGGQLSWLEQLCLRSFVTRGHGITLYAYQDVQGVPEGVDLRDGREIIDTDDFIKYEKKDSFALFADYFRIVLTDRRPHVLWVDTDVYCVAPPDYPAGHVFGLESPSRINNAVLGLAPGSDLQRSLLEFMSDREPIPDFLPRRLREEYREAQTQGTPVHVSRMPWGVWGPMAITHFAKQHGVTDQAHPQDAFYPVHFRDKGDFLEQPETVWRKLTERTTALHLWASNKRALGGQYNGLAPAHSFLDMLCRAEGIDPAASPIVERGRLRYDANQVQGAAIPAAAPPPTPASMNPASINQAEDFSAVIAALDLDDVTQMADVGGTAPGLCLALFHRFDCDLNCFDMVAGGTFSDQTSPSAQAWYDSLRAANVPAARLRIVQNLDDVTPQDVIATLDGFGVRHKIAALAPMLDKALPVGSRLILDIRKGSGAFPFLRARGNANTVSEGQVDGRQQFRVVLSAEPSSTTAQTAPKQDTSNKNSWASIATDLAGPQGWFREGENHSFLHVPRGDTLVVTFDNLDIAMEKRDDRRPWGWSFIEQQGWSALGVMAGGWTWFRDPFVSDTFDELRESGFFEKFLRVVFYGASMGGYGATAFSAACPGAHVVAISPQSTLDKTIVPWEARYKVAWGQDFSGPYGDAALSSQSAASVNLLYDPYVKADAAHAARFEGQNVTRWRCPLLGHRLGSSLNQMGVLKDVVYQAVEGSLTPDAFRQLLRARREFPRYQRELANLALERNHEALALRVADHVLSTRDDRFFRQLRARLN